MGGGGPCGLLLGIASLVAALCPLARASTPDNEATLVVFNNISPVSADLAGYYAEKRGIPFTHVIGLDCPMKETIERAEYERTIAEPLRKVFNEREWWRIAPVDPAVLALSTGGAKISAIASASDSSGAVQPLAVIENKIRFIVLMDGIPLKIAEAPNYPGDIPNGPAPMNQSNAAAVDSELACVGFLSKSLSGALNNPYYRSYRNFGDAGLPGMMLVCRLDAPTPQTVRRMIDDSVSAEKNGLWGVTLVDSRGLLKSGEKGSASLGAASAIQIGSIYEGDAWLERIVADARRSGVPVLDDDHPEVIPADYPLGKGNIAQYYGWYTEDVSGALAREDFRFVPGAIACHIHSFSASTLHDPRKGWVGPLLAHGAAASMGTVFEPYLAYTPNLDIFEQHLRSGFTFAESAYASLRVLSWMTTVVGDPLYTPFKPIRDNPPPDSAAEFEAYRKGAQAWFGSSRQTGEAQLIQSGRKLRSGLIFEHLGLLEADGGNAPGAASAFQEAAKYFKSEGDQMRTTIHLVELLRKLNKPKEALGVIDKTLRARPKARGAEVLRSIRNELAPPPPPPAPSPTSSRLPTKSSG